MASSKDVRAAVDLIEAATFDPSHWDSALRAVARATGSSFGQIIAMGGPQGSSLNRLPDLDPDLLRQWGEGGFDHPAVNSRVRIGASAPVLQSLDESAFTTALDSRLNPAYGALIEQADIPFICLTTLVREQDFFVGMAVLRGAAQGNIERDQRRRFDVLARHMRRAALGTRAMGISGAAQVARGFDAVRAPAFVCDGAGRVLALSAAAEALLSQDDRLVLCAGRLVNRMGEHDLSDLARAVARGGFADLPACIVRSPGESDGRTPLVVEITPLPGDAPGFPGVPGAIIIVRPAWQGTDARLQARMIALYGLTAREAEVALALCRGLSPSALALSLGMTLGTARTHIRRLIDKTGAGSITQLVALLRAYDG